MIASITYIKLHKDLVIYGTKQSCFEGLRQLKQLVLHRGSEADLLIPNVELHVYVF